MAGYPYRNRLLGQYRATRYMVGPQASGLISDIADPARGDLALSSTSGVANTETGDDPRVDMPAGVSLEFDLSVDRLNLVPNTTILFAGVAFAPGSSGVDGQTVNLFALTPKDYTGAQMAIVISARWAHATRSLQIFGQLWDGYGWTSDKFVELPHLDNPQPVSVFVSATCLAVGEDEHSIECVVYVPGAVPVKFQAFSYFKALETLQIGSLDYMVGNRPDIGAPPVSGNTLGWGFWSLTQTPTKMNTAQIIDVLNAKHGGTPFIGNTQPYTWPQANSVATLAAPADALPLPLFQELLVDGADRIFAPAALETSIAVLVNPADRSVWERVQVVGVDVLSNTVTVERGVFGDPVLDWPTGTELRGSLQPENGLLLPTKRNQPLSGDFSYLTSATDEIVLVATPVRDASGSTAKFVLPEDFYVTEVGLFAASPITAGTLSLGTPDAPTAYLNARATANLEPNGGRWSYRDLLPGKGSKEYLVTLAGGTGVGKPYIKGFYRTFSI